MLMTVGTKIGELYIDRDGNIYRLESYCDYPSVSLENINTKTFLVFARRSPIDDGMKRLVEEK